MDSEKMEQILQIFNKIDVCCVSTLNGNIIKNRMMHFVYDEEKGVIYLTSTKNDPKVIQLKINSNISLLIYDKGKNFPEDKEIEISGFAKILNKESERERAIKLLINRSPVVKNLVEIKKDELLTFIEVKPILIKFRAVADILRGIQPYVIETGNVNKEETELEILKRKIKAWIEESRYPFLSVSILTVTLGTAMAWINNNIINFYDFFLTLLGVIFLHIGTNIINDYFDHKTGNDDINNEFVRPFSGGARMIQMGLLTSFEVLVGGILFFTLGSTIGIYFIYKYGYPILIIGIVGILSGIFYVSPKINFVKSGIGEILVGTNLGVLTTIGSYYVQTRTFSLDAFLLSIPFGILITCILLINEIPDFVADSKTDKKTIAVRIGKENTIKLFIYLIFLSYLILILYAILFKWYVIFSLVSVPIAIKTIKHAMKNFNNSFELAKSNGLTILVFNITIITIILTNIFLTANFNIFIVLAIFGIFYVVWMYRTIIKQHQAFIKLKGIANA